MKDKIIVGERRKFTGKNPADINKILTQMEFNKPDDLEDSNDIKNLMEENKQIKKDLKKLEELLKNNSARLKEKNYE